MVDEGTINSAAEKYGNAVIIAKLKEKGLYSVFLEFVISKWEAFGSDEAQVVNFFKMVVPAFIGTLDKDGLKSKLNDRYSIFSANF